METCQGNNIN